MAVRVRDWFTSKNATPELFSFKKEPEEQTLFFPEMDGNYEDQVHFFLKWMVRIPSKVTVSDVGEMHLNWNKSLREGRKEKHKHSIGKCASLHGQAAALKHFTKVCGHVFLNQL